MDIDNTKRQAEQAWEALVKMKGGREKLHSVQNVLREDPNRKKVENSFVRLWVFPDREWQFAVFMNKPQVNIWNGKKFVYQFIDDYGTIDTEPVENSQKWYFREWAIFMLETKWFKPEAVSIRRIKRKKKTFDVITTNIEGFRLDYTFEPEQMLVLEVDTFYKGKAAMKHSFKDYVEIDGIKMPTKTSLNWNPSLQRKKEKIRYHPIKYRFNVGYDLELFEKPKNWLNLTLGSPENRKTS